MQMFFQIKNNF